MVILKKFRKQSLIYLSQGIRERTEINPKKGGGGK